MRIFSLVFRSLVMYLCSVTMGNRDLIKSVGKYFPGFYFVKGWCRIVISF